LLPTGFFAVTSEKEEDDDDNKKKTRRKKKEEKKPSRRSLLSFFSSVSVNIPQYFQDAVATTAGSCTPEFICLVAHS
jgi:hypothetical protein